MPHPWHPADRALLQALAALTAQALDRLRAHQAERDATREIRRLGEALQRRVVLGPGATVLLYTDGLVERRDQVLDDGMDRLRSAAAELHALSPQQLCDALLDRLARESEDDVALLVLRVRA